MGCLGNLRRPNKLRLTNHVHARLSSETVTQLGSNRLSLDHPRIDARIASTPHSPLLFLSCRILTQRNFAEVWVRPVVSQPHCLIEIQVKAVAYASRVIPEIPPLDGEWVAMRSKIHSQQVVARVMATPLQVCILDAP